MEISLVIREVQRDGSDTAFLYWPLCFPACLDPRAGVDIVVVRKARTNSETLYM